MPLFRTTNSITQHPDLPSTITSYNIDNPSVSNPLSNNDEIAHSNQCLGIMVASQNNSIGIAGIAPSCNALAVSIDWHGTTVDQELSYAINYAYPLCDVINCSWRRPSVSAQIDEAINNALTMGRNTSGTRLGTVVVFSSGNDVSGMLNNPLSYPASDAISTYPDIIAVGASSTCYERKWFEITSYGPNHFSCNDGDAWGSGSGDGLDIVAPGESIFLLDTQTTSLPSAGRYVTNSGTSYAAAQVSAVAALVLSLYPCLTEYQVGQLIDQAATKIGTYTYSITTANPFGTWTSNVGYGMLNAYATLNQIVGFSYLQDDDVTDVQKKYSLNFIQAGYDVNSNQNPGYYKIDNTGNVDIKAQQYILFEPGFQAVPGSVMHAHIDQFTGDCTNWVPSFSHKPPRVYMESASAADSVQTINTNSIITSAISMSPNPFKNSFVVNFDALTDGESSSVKVYDLTGRVIYQQSGTESLGLHTYNIPVNTGASLYIVEACMGGTCVTQKMVKYEMD